MILSTGLLIPATTVLLALELCFGQPVKSTLPRPHICGDANIPKIITGPVVGVGEYPWTALIHYRDPTEELSFSCAGTLMNERYVLTAAHCVREFPEDWKIVGVRLGEYDVKTDQDCEGEGPYKICADLHQDFSVEKIIVHEDYNATKVSSWNDIALIRLAQDVVYSEYIHPVCLPIGGEERHRNNTNQRAIEVGWSKTLEGSLSDKRLKTLVTIKDRSVCDKVYKVHGIKLRDTQLCVSRENDDNDCYAIAGSPLMQTVGRTHFLYGIASFGPTSCALKNVPDVFTNVAKFVDWIESKIE